MNKLNVEHLQSLKFKQTFQYIEADSSKFIDVGMVYLRYESDLRWRHGIFLWEKKFQLEMSVFERRLMRKSKPETLEPQFSGWKEWKINQVRIQVRLLTSFGPLTSTWNSLAFCWSGTAWMPGTGSLIKRLVSWEMYNMEVSHCFAKDNQFPSCWGKCDEKLRQWSYTFKILRGSPDITLSEIIF